MPKDDIFNKIQPEFPRPVDVTSFGKKGRHFKFQATAEEERALSERYSVLNVNELVAKCKLTPTRKGAYKLEGEFSASIYQKCSISLDSIEEKVSGKFALTLQQNSQQDNREPSGIDFDYDEEDTEYIESNIVDVGEVVAQYLSIEINPYPRKQNATGEELGKKVISEEDAMKEQEKKNPFAVLKSLKHKT